MSSMSSDISLEDESCEPCFSGATLSLSSNTGITDSNGNQSVVNNNNNTTPLNTTPLNTTPLNTTPLNTTPLNTTPLNTIPLNTVAYNTMRSSLTQLDTDCNDFYGLREDLIERAIQDCKPVIINGMDGSLLCASLLTEIDYWDTEKERLIFVCDNSIIVMKYDLISLKLLEYQRYLWSKLDLIVIGELKYPSTSLIPSRNQFGIRLMWNKGRPLDFVNKWNPWSKSVPWLTLTSHPLALEFGSEVNTTKYDINHFNGFVVNAIQQYNSLKRDTNLNNNNNINNNNNNNNNNSRDNSVNENEMQIVYQPIIIENYANVASAVYNLANMGFFKSRGTFSF